MNDDEVIESLEAHIAEKTISFREAMERYDLIGANYDPVHGSYVIMAERDPKMSATTAFQEMGYASPSPFTAWTREERLPELREKLGIRKYYDMKRADGTVRGALRLLKTPVMGARWFVQSASDSTIDTNIAKFVEDNLFKELNNPWYRVLEDVLLMCEYGYMPLEKVYDINSDGKMVLRKLAPRHPLDIQEWIYDVNGGPKGIIMDPTEANGWSEIAIPIEKLVVFVLEQEAGDMRGISILRSAYKHYYYKDTMYKIDAIQKERHGIGVPIIKMPLGYSEKDKSLAEDLGRNLRTNERAHITIPANWEVAFAKLEGQPVDCLTSIKHHDDRIMTNILAPFYDDSSAQENAMQMFYKATRYIAFTIAETFNRYVIKQLVDFNYSRGQYPILRARRIGESEDLRTLSFAIRNFVGAGIVTPDEKLEDFIRNESDLPMPEHSTRRVILAPAGANQSQPTPGKSHYEPPNSPAVGTNNTNTNANQPVPPKPPKVGLPRQQNLPPTGAGRSNIGNDRSGG
jgi:hypothetical protein